MDRIHTVSAGWSRSKKGRVLAQKSGNGQGKYKSVSLGAGNYGLVHRLVAKAFIPNPENKAEINHKDKNTVNNAVENLEWCSRAENVLHSQGKKVTLLSPKGKIVFFSSISGAARHIGVNSGNMSRLVNKKKYNHIKGWKLWEEL